MFKKLASDALGLSDIGQVVKPSDYDKTESDDYVLTETNEKIHFLIKSKTDEYCFTNLALIHLDGESAMSKKRTLSRYDYYKHPVKNVQLETAGTIDLDLEISFSIGAKMIKIDINKNQAEEIADLYKSLISISLIQDADESTMETAEDSLNIAKEIMKNGKTVTPNENLDLLALTETAYSWITTKRKELTKKDFSSVFEKYINN